MITRSLIVNVLLSAFIIIAGTLWVFKKEVRIFAGTACGPVPAPSHLTYNIPDVRSHIHIPSLRPFIQRIRPSPRLYVYIYIYIYDMFHNRLIFYSEGLLAPSPKLEDHSLSFVRGRFFYAFAATFHSWRPPSIRNRRKRCAVVTAPPNVGISTTPRKCVGKWGRGVTRDQRSQ
jgi:hypothetical protein